MTFSTQTYGDVSPIFSGHNTETMSMLFLTLNIVVLILLGSLEAILTSIWIVS